MTKRRGEPAREPVPIWLAAQTLGLNVQNVEQMILFKKLKAKTDRFGRCMVNAADLERVCKQRAERAKQRAARKERWEREHRHPGLRKFQGW